MTGSQELVTGVRTVKQFLTYVSEGPFQYAVAEALRLPDTYFDDFRADLQRKRGLLGEKDAVAFCRTLPERCGVVAIPNSVFYDDPDAGRSQVRFAFCKKDDVLTEAISRLRRLAS